jgi:hypothetical protein
MEIKKNARKIASEYVFAAAANCKDSACTGIERDLRNPYAFVVEVDGKKFRVIVKELAVQSDPSEG